MNEEKNIKQIEETKKEEKISFEMRIIGWIGTFILILAYGLNSLNHLSTTNILYPVMNLIASILLAIRVWTSKNWSNLFLELFWGAIALVAIIKFFIN